VRTPENTTACIERPFPTGATSVVARIDNSEDAGLTWGGGLALLWPGGQALSINLRTPENRFGVDSTAAPQKLVGTLGPTASAVLRIRLTDSEVLAESWTDDAKSWQTLARSPRSQFPGAPATLRLGKFHSPAALDDHTAPGPPAACRVDWLKALK
jgi:hypothetical protein